MANALKVFLGLLVASVLLISIVRCEGSEDLDDSENRDDLETAEFLFWPKLFFAKAAIAKSAAYHKTIQVNTVPVTYSYKPVTYTAYKWVPVPYQYTVQQPFVEKTVVASSVPSTVSSSTVVKAPGLSVNVQKTGGFVSVNSGVDATASTLSSSSTTDV